MEYYHIHTKGNQDKLWHESREFVVDAKWNNRTYKRCNDFSVAVPTENYPRLAAALNLLLSINGFKTADEQAKLNDLIDVGLDNNVRMSLRENEKLLRDATIILNNASVFQREMALENYRKEHAPQLPSRMHSLYVTTEEGVKYWQRYLLDNDLEVFRLELFQEPFTTNEQLIPGEDLTYQESYNQAKNYWYPNLRKFASESNEYLYQGRVRILKKVDEIKKSKK